MEDKIYMLKLFTEMKELKCARNENYQHDQKN